MVYSIINPHKIFGMKVQTPVRNIGERYLGSAVLKIKISVVFKDSPFRAPYSKGTTRSNCTFLAL